MFRNKNDNFLVKNDRDMRVDSKKKEWKKKKPASHGKFVTNNI